MTEEETKVYVTAYRDIPYAVLDDDLTTQLRNNFFAELSEIKTYYEAYAKGVEFFSEGTKGDYVPSNLKFKKARNIINQEARFMFSQPLDIIINKNNNASEEDKKNNTIINEFVTKVLTKNHFNSNILKAAKDCFIGKRICIVLNFNDETGIKINFLNALEFYYEIKDDELTKLVAFFVENDSTTLSDKVIRKKTYEIVNGKCYITEGLYDGSGRQLEEPEDIETDLDVIPAWIVFNDGLVNDKRGESDIAQLLELEKGYNKIGNADIDAERKSMNPIKYTIDASTESTTDLPTGPGAYWDIQSDSNGVEQKKATVGQINPAMDYSQPLDTTLTRIEDEMFSEMSVPNINSNKLQGMITSGKTLQALYWPLEVRSNEKILVWYDALTSMVEMLYRGAMLYPGSAKKYLDEQLPSMNLDIHVESNYAIPEDEESEKIIDLQEVAGQTMSKKSYMKKWRGLTDEEADEELKQIALERQLLEDSMSGEDLGLNDDEEMIE